jgi:Holliday junction DNA helicase RuvA
VIGSLNGRLSRKGANRVIIEAGGVGYLVTVPISTYFHLGDPGSQAFLLIHTHVREDAIQLYGFATELELQVFDHLIAVSGIGPRMAVTILSGIPPEDLVVAIRGGDVKRLTAVPGLGKKTSERLVVELRDKLADLAPGTSPTLPASSADPVRADAISALVNLGYRQKDAEAAVDRARGANDQNLEALLRAALGVLAR